MAPHACLALTTLGSVGLSRRESGGGETALLGPGKPIALLVYLAFSPGRTAGREHLVDLLWSDVDPKAASHSFRQTVWYLKQRLGEEAFETREGSLALAVPLASDRDEFLAAIEGGDLARAAQLYKGDFLPGFGAPGAADFEHWADVERYRLRLMFLRSAETLVRRQLSTGHAREAQHLAHRVRDLDRSDERGWRLLIEALLSANDTLALAVEADGLERFLLAEGREPEPSTRALLDLARRTPAGAEQPGGPRPLVAELIGREREFASILAAWETSRHGPGRHLHITAAAGLGKTRLLGDVHARLRATGARVVSLGANAGERHIAYAFAAELAAQLAELPGAAGISTGSASILVGLNPTLTARFAASPDRSGDAEALRRRTVALCELAAALADEAPLAVLIDDVHWADEPSRAVLQGLVDHVAQCRALIVTSARPVQEGRLETASTEALALEPLTADEVAALIASLGALPQEPWAAGFPDGLYSSAGGSPLLVIETLQLLGEKGILVLGGAGWECAAPASLTAELSEGSALKNRIAHLERGQGWLLVLLGAAGTPLSADLLARGAGRPLEAVEADLAAMEQRGLVVHVGAEWEPAHDEIAASALEIATAEARHAAHQVLGNALETPEADLAQLLRAGHHAAAAGEEDVLERLFPRVVLAARRRGDRRPLGKLAQELLGEGASREGARRLVRRLPLYIRAGLTSRSRVGALAATVAAAVVVPAVIVSRAPPPLPDAVLIAAEGEPHGSVRAYRVELKRQGWPQEPSLDVAAVGTPYRVSFPEMAVMAAPSPDGSQWVFRREVADSGGNEMFLAGPRGSIRRLTYSHGDDMNADWSPDGLRLAFQTTRWNPHAWSDIATMDLATGRVRQLTSSDNTDYSPRWSPDGTRIAFSRSPQWGSASHNLRSAPYVCWVGVLGGQVHCSRVARGGVGGWYDAQELLVLVDTAGRPALVRLNLDTDEMRVVARADSAGAFAVSPDGQWAACYCQARGQARGEWYVFPLDNPDRRSRIAVGSEDPSRFTVKFLPNGHPAAPLERIVVAEASGSIPVGTTHGLLARGYDTGGEPVPLRHLAWWSPDTAIATVNESTGVVLPKRIGQVMIHVSAGGWRGAWARLRVGEPLARTVLTESWSGSLEAAWVPYGVPLPRLDTGPGGVASFLNNGDGTFQSGAYSLRQFDGRHGLGMDVRLSTPLNAVEYQWITVMLAQVDSAALAAWDHRTGSGAGIMGFDCGAGYPGGNGDPAALPFISSDRSITPVPGWVRSGSWYTLRVQLFPDGSCGVAINGRPVGRTNATNPGDRPYRVFLSGASVGTKMLVGPLEVWEGVRTDVDWSALERPGAAQRAFATPPARFPARLARQKG